MSKRDRSGTPALRVVEKAGVEFELLQYEHDDGQVHFGDESVEKLGLSADVVFKTLMVQLTGSKHPYACAVVPVSGMLNLKSCAAALGAKKAAMCQAADAERLTGYVVGGISPLGQKRRFPVIIDEGAKDLDFMVISAGKRGNSLKLSPMALQQLTRAIFAPVAQAS